MFEKYILNFETNIFNELASSCRFENIAKGREGANLIELKYGLVPLVRTTTPYNNPTQCFSSIHYDIIDKIKAAVAGAFNIRLNAALIEIYDNNYKTMKFHSDQELDLEENSYICIFSCYETPGDLRRLIIKNKTSKNISEISMENNSVVLFSTETNRNYQHKIVGTNKWLGITFRLSKTFIKFVNSAPYHWPRRTRLTLATKEEALEFYKLKGKENAAAAANFRSISYTLSPGDLLPIAGSL